MRKNYYQGDTTKMNVREATIDDLPVLLDFEQNIIESERPYDVYIKENDVTYYDLPQLLSDSESIVVVMESSGGIVGCGYAQIKDSKPCLTHDKHCYLGFIYLEPEYRGKALGKHILESLKAWGLNKGMKHFQLGVYSDNEGAIRAYEKAGFGKVSVLMEMVV